MIVLNKDLYDQFAAKELTLEQVEEAVDVDPAPAPTPLPQDQYEKEVDIAMTKLNEVISSKAADLNTGLPLSHAAMQKLIKLAVDQGVPQEEAEENFADYLEDAGYLLFGPEDEQEEFEELRTEAPCIRWVDVK